MDLLDLKTILVIFAGWWWRTCSTLSLAAYSGRVTTPLTSPDACVVSQTSTWPPSAACWIMTSPTPSTPAAPLCSTNPRSGWTSSVQAAWRYLIWRRCLTYVEKWALPQSAGRILHFRCGAHLRLTEDFRQEGLHLSKYAQLQYAHKSNFSFSSPPWHTTRNSTFYSEVIHFNMLPLVILS